jgi:hypothetical protein
MSKFYMGRNEFGFAVLIFACCFYFIPYLQLNHFTYLPGDLGDSRLNNYFLENIYLYFFGRTPSLIHLSFFYPFPYLLGFSDNLFGSFPFYLPARIFTGEPASAFLIWYGFSYVLNYFAVYYVLRKLNMSAMASIVGAIIFTFAFPVSAQTSHVQLAYRFAIPLAVLGVIQFLEGQSWKDLRIAFAWMIWQFYCSIYLGFFLILLIGAIFVVFGVYLLLHGKNFFFKSLGIFFTSWLELTSRRKILFIFVVSMALVALAILFYPYLMVSQLYGAKRSVSEIANMLPRPRSYLLMEESWLWSFLGQYAPNIPMRHEHQIFFGLTPLLLAAIGFIFGGRKRNSLAYILMAGCLFLLITLTLNLHGHSLWFYLAQLPLASAIRAITRIVLVMLLPVAYLSAFGVDLIPRKLDYLKYLIIICLIFEFSTVHVNSSSLEGWRERVSASMQLTPKNLPDSSILFFAQHPGRSNPDQELDAMWVALILGLPTLNGYSGNTPPRFNENFGNDCIEASHRIESYVIFEKSTHPSEDFGLIARRVVPIGFDGCDIGKIITYKY